MPDHSFSAPAGRLNRWLALALVVSTLALLGWLGWRALRTGLYARAALDDLARLQTVMAQPSLSALPQAQADLDSFQTHLAEARAAGSPFLRIAPAFRWAPRFGPDLAATPQLVEVALEVATASRLASDALTPIARLLSDGGGLDALPQALDSLVAARPALEEAHARLDRAAELRANLPPLHEPRLARQIDKLDKLLPLAQQAIELAQAAPALLGADQPRTYLLLAQNSDELRATGGFISGAGHVTIDRGKLTDLSLTDSYSVDNWEKPHPEPPAALRKYMAADLWVLRDANWSPDFPTSADVARALYAQDRGVETDGAVALDLEAVRSLVGAVGPLQVPGIAEPISGENALSWMKSAWENPPDSAANQAPGAGDWWTKRKDFMGDLVKAALAKIQAGGSFDPVALARTLYAELDTRHIQLSVDDPTLAALLATQGWDGGLRPPASSDFLFVVDSNVGFNKANLLVREAFDYRVEAVGGNLVATLKIPYTHTAPAKPGMVCDKKGGYGPDYQDLAARCYWDYLRVYVPGGSELIGSEGLNSPASEPGEGGTTVFSGDFVLQPGADHVITLRYRLPAATPTGPYRLFVRKQAGTAGWPLAVTFGDCHQETKLTTDFRLKCPPVAAQP